MTIDDAIKCARERAESWKLNREDCDFNNACSECATACEAEEKECEQLEEWLSELKKYKYAEEQGLLLRLPCKVGDTVYRPIPKLYRTYTESVVTEIYIKESGIYFSTDKGTNWKIETIGKTFFLTKEEAEKKLKEMESDK